MTAGSFIASHRHLVPPLRMDKILITVGNLKDKCIVCGTHGESLPVLTSIFPLRTSIAARPASGSTPLIPAISDAYYCTECTRLEKDRDGCPRIINVSSSPPPSFVARSEVNGWIEIDPRWAQVVLTHSTNERRTQ